MTEETSEIETPHEHDVLSGRGNFVNYHVGNEYFRALVRKYKVDYVKCPKPQKGKYSKLIYDDIKARDPPGRFLKQDSTTKLWCDIGEKKALDKTRQALREGAPDLAKEMSGEDEGGPSDVDEVPNTVRRDSMGHMMPGGVPHPYMVGSPGMNNRNHLNVSPQMMASPQIMSPNMIISPGMQQLSANSVQTQRTLASQMGQMIPPPQVHQQPSMEQLQQLQQQQQMMMMMNQQGLNNYNFQNTNLELEQALRVNQSLEREMQMMQSKLDAIYASQERLKKNNEQSNLEPTPLGAAAELNTVPIPVEIKSMSNPKVELPTSQNSRRKPPPSLLVREESLKLDKIFGSPGSAKKKFDANESTGALSAMSMSLADMSDDGNLSAIFNNSVKIVEDDLKVALKDAPANNMSVATLGDTDHMSFNESSGNMSFSNVFEDT